MTGITHSTAAKVIAGYFNTDATHVGGCYDAYSVRDNDGRMWKIMRDASVRCENRSGQKVKLPPATVRKAIKDLKKARLIETEQRYRNQGWKSSLFIELNNTLIYL